ncbi:MAG: hypothetical protein ACD_2C00241G0005 [uncultured bacterium (gcode 4)]|uniref:Uncharacterized protein n=1 Tax=uncultured bacterium (gcode 4) TaxID=1234023 RepID=K2G417_9BACT|nr:MAG: hypothetical protein ACD_2C00241G0005 [uncultured bacterium (gcode 4)]
MKTKLSILILSSFLLFSCGNNTEDASDINKTNWITSSWNEKTEGESKISPDTSNEATEIPEEIDTWSWETATVTEFSSATWINIKSPD